MRRFLIIVLVISLLSVSAMGETSAEAFRIPASLETFMGFFRCRRRTDLFP